MPTVSQDLAWWVTVLHSDEDFLQAEAQPGVGEGEEEITT